MDSLTFNSSGAGNQPVALINVSAPCLALTWTVIILRVYVRGCVIRRFGWDDGTMILAILLYTGLCASMIISARLNIGSSAGNGNATPIYVQPDMAGRLVGTITANLVLYMLVITIVRVSLCIFFLRVAGSLWQRRVILATTAIASVYIVVFILLVIFRCGNPSNFAKTKMADSCISDSVLQPMFYVAAAATAIADWICLFFPLYLLWKADIPRTAKISAGGLLIIGALGSVAALVEIAYIPGTRTRPRVLSDAVQIDIWAIVQPAVYIFAMSMATLRPLFSMILQRRDSRGWTDRLSYCGDRSKASASYEAGGSSALENLDHAYADYQNGHCNGTMSSSPESRSLKRLTVISEVSIDESQEGDNGEGFSRSFYSLPTPQLPSPVYSTINSRL